MAAEDNLPPPNTFTEASPEERLAVGDLAELVCTAVDSSSFIHMGHTGTYFLHIRDRVEAGSDASNLTRINPMRPFYVDRASRDLSSVTITPERRWTGGPVATRHEALVDELHSGGSAGFHEITVVKFLTAEPGIAESTVVLSATSAQHFEGLMPVTMIELEFIRTYDPWLADGLYTANSRLSDELNDGTSKREGQVRQIRYIRADSNTGSVATLDRVIVEEVIQTQDAWGGFIISTKRVPFQQLLLEGLQEYCVPRLPLIPALTTAQWRELFIHPLQSEDRLP